jgi:hypothetical protein
MEKVEGGVYVASRVKDEKSACRPKHSEYTRNAKFSKGAEMGRGLDEEG